ncbi:energy-coupling factor ABC transporter ATP-binding protein [Lederbergia wuyishanensis]|uniref:Energy-coupling factor transport system ATP-binding protein n=1 Tax=Lederbergia wuyishanensis TaxID=1347903 RepID=A0ABU0DAI2_9BACI|nr:energy-coupling factor ABC transporter ATP-binding protein [Lederbergia wuyishanensis]MCJ8009695.1 energy-coupling factor ABC transporter ATP-binding protein [Lederbergia wuyishanensis]MDQ0345427.1 energy-coupling factor transport system ATP-binding protein [Lederbergia wuyishanensis]
MSSSVISINNVSFKYEGQESFALSDVSITVKEGEWLAIVGHNGSGKSTLAKILNGLQFPQNGSVLVGDIPLSSDSVWDIRKLVGMVFQNPDNQFVGATVQDDVAFGLENNGVPHEEMLPRVKQALQHVKMIDFLDQEPHHLSGGQKQRVAIAGVIALQPKVIILDEATSMLDPLGREEVIKTVRGLKDEQGLTVISITHDLEEAAQADRIVVMNRGTVYKEGTPDEIFLLEEELIKLGLDIPFPIKMAKALREKGFEVPRNYLTDAELVNELWTLHFKM